MIIIQPDAITDFRKDYFFLSNFYPCQVFYNGLMFPNSEGAYMSCKNDNREDHVKLSEMKTAREAREYGQKIHIRSNWEDVKYDSMKNVLRDKFTRNLHLGIKLLETGDRQLVEGGTWHDQFWGICNCSKHQGEGKNALGQILMEIRDELNELKELKND
jgi:ribA/ribD-fused uncharacterized protein